MKKIITIVGARPQFVKAAMLTHQFKALGIEEKMIHTGQHFDANMSDIFFKELGIPTPAYQLNIHNLTHGAMTGRMIEEIEKILLNEKTDGLLVYGDTNSTLAGALAAVKLGIPVIHIEAGLRSYNSAMPEEVNRIITDRISTALFCPTDKAIENLKREGFENMPVSIFKNGDVMQDAAIYYAAKAEQKTSILKQINASKFILATIHRQENTDSPENLRDIVSGLNEINHHTSVIVPIHPRTRQILIQSNIIPEFKLIDPVGYFDMITLLKNCDLVITDSGGVQKEAFFFGKHCITLREQTEWVELVDNGFNILVGSNLEKLKNAFDFFNNKTSDFDMNLYGKGHAAKIAAIEIAKL